MMLIHSVSLHCRHIVYTDVADLCHSLRAWKANSCSRKLIVGWPTLRQNFRTGIIWLQSSVSKAFQYLSHGTSNHCSRRKRLRMTIMWVNYRWFVVMWNAQLGAENLHFGKFRGKIGILNSLSEICSFLSEFCRKLAQSTLLTHDDIADKWWCNCCYLLTVFLMFNFVALFLLAGDDCQVCVVHSLRVGQRCLPGSLWYLEQLRS